MATDITTSPVSRDPAANRPNPTIRHVALSAGVSPTTVWRVLNDADDIPAATVEAVHRAVAETGYTPTRRRRPGRRISPSPIRGRRIGFFIVDYSPWGSNPAYERLIRGVLKASEESKFDVQMGMLDIGTDVVERLKSSRFDGLILHGTQPSDQDCAALYDTPTVWLMGGRRRPTWGDQVMPDNDTIGRIAANYLLSQGHRNVIYFGFKSAWFFHTRASAFQQVIEDAGGHVTSIQVPLPDFSINAAQKDKSVRQLFGTLRSMREKATGLFVAEDWLLAHTYRGAAEAGLKIGKDLTVISCNNDEVSLGSVAPRPATIDIFFESIARQAVAQLGLRLQGRMPAENLRVLVQPSLVLP